MPAFRQTERTGSIVYTSVAPIQIKAHNAVNLSHAPYLRETTRPLPVRSVTGYPSQIRARLLKQVSLCFEN